MSTDPIRREIHALRARIDECLQRIETLERQLARESAPLDIAEPPVALGTPSGPGAPSDPFEYVYTPRRIRSQTPPPPEHPAGFTIRDLPLPRPHPLASQTPADRTSGGTSRVVYRGLNELLGGLDVSAPGDGF